MNRKVVFYCLLAGLYGCGNGDAGQKEGKEFEGVITYRIDYRKRNDRSVYGDTMKVYYSKGNLARVYNSEGQDALRKEVILSESHRYYAQKAMSDTVYTYDISLDAHLKLLETRRFSDDTRIMGHTCKKIEFDQEYMGEVKFYVYDSYMYSDDVLKVEKLHFKNSNFGHFNNFIKEAGVFYLKFESRYLYSDKTEISVKTVTAVNIREQKVDPGIFHIDTTTTKALQL
jgi:hypothetical protein